MLVVDVLHETGDRGEAARMQAAWQKLLDVLTPPIEAAHGIVVASLVEIVIIETPRKRWQVIAARPDKTPDISTDMVVTVTAAVYAQLRKSAGRPEVQPPAVRKPVAGNNFGRTVMSGRARKWSAGDAYR